VTPVNSGQFADATEVPVVFWHASPLRRGVAGISVGLGRKDR
jgi:hypothetical protein